MNQHHAITRRKRILITGMLLSMAFGTLGVLKYESMKEQAAAHQAQALSHQQMVARTADMTQAMAMHYHGLSANAQQVALVARVGKAIAATHMAKAQMITLRFHLLAEENAINLFALPSGDIYITTALVNRMKTEGQLAAALSHGAAHVLWGDMLELIANPNAAPQPLWAHPIASETLADARGITLMSQAGYDPNAMIGMFTVLLEAYQAKADVAFFSTHPNIGDRILRITHAIQELYPNGVPLQLSK